MKVSGKNIYLSVTLCVVHVLMSSVANAFLHNESIIGSKEFGQYVGNLQKLDGISEDEALVDAAVEFGFEVAENDKDVIQMADINWLAVIGCSAAFCAYNSMLIVLGTGQIAAELERRNDLIEGRVEEPEKKIIVP